MKSRNEVIDLIRGLSILSVILLHCKVHLPIDQTLLSIVWVKWLLGSGYYGVVTFFVVSGFLITSACIKKWEQLPFINIGQFYLMRFSRIVPCLVALLGVLSLLHVIGVSGFVITNTSLKQATFSAATFQINWLQAKVGYLPASWDILWSLSIEEVFYLFFPVACFILRNQKYLAVMMLIFIFLGPLARTEFTENEIWSDHSYLSCMDGIAFGCLAAMLANKVRTTRQSRCLLFLGFVLTGFIFFFRKQSFDIGVTSLGLNVTFLELGVALILLATQQTHLQWFGMIRWFGRNSYEIYLTHSIVLIFAVSFLFHSVQQTWIILLEYIFIIVCSGLLGELISTFYSVPLNRYIRERSLMNVTNAPSVVGQ